MPATQKNSKRGMAMQMMDMPMMGMPMMCCANLCVCFPASPAIRAAFSDLPR